MGRRSVPRRNACLFEHRVVGKAAKRGVTTAKLLLRKEPDEFSCGYPFKPFFAPLRRQGSPSPGRRKK